jgi:dihydroxyacetone kinase-like protein
MRKVLEKLDGAEGDDIGATLKAVGMALVSSVGGASGPLYGTLFMQMGAGAAGATELDLAGWTEALAKGTAGVQARGKAELEDKTMVDALIPAVEALKEHAGDSLADALTASADAAQKGMEATIPLVARKGRASYLGERSADHQDPGATSTHLLIRAAADTLAG